MVMGAIVVLLAGFLAGAAAERLRLPRLLGMLLIGVVLGPYALDVINVKFLAMGPDIRLLALVVILLKAGLGLDRGKLTAHGTVALRLGALPATLEASALAALARYLLDWSWPAAGVLGWVVCAESPAVLVPMMLRLKAEGWGVKTGIPDLILAGGALSDVVAITAFGAVLSMAAASSTGSIVTAGLQIVVQIAGGVVIGYGAGKAVTCALSRCSLTQSAVQDLIVTLVAVVLVVLAGERVGYSGYLAAMTAGFVILNTNPVLARRIRQELDRVWVAAEIFLFVMIGAAVNIGVLAGAGASGLLIVFGGLILGRTPGIWLATAGSSLTRRERLFLNLAYIPKATVQAAIGAIPLAIGIPHGEAILAIAVLAIAVTAPLGAIGISAAAPRMLDRGEVDPTKITVKEKYRFLVALDGHGGAVRALQKAAGLARQVDGTIVVLHVETNETSRQAAESLFRDTAGLAGDVEHQLVVSGGNPVETIVEAATRYRADFVFMGKIERPGVRSLLVGDVTQRVVEQLSVPVIVVE